jgi:hypothetical protein
MRTAIVVLAPATTLIGTARAQVDPGWPQQIASQSSTFIYYQPQADDWKNFTDLSRRMAFSLTPEGGYVNLNLTREGSKHLVFAQR